jgi:hypothetical protein
MCRMTILGLGIPLFRKEAVDHERRPDEEAREAWDEKSRDQLLRKSVLEPDIRERRSGAQEHHGPEYPERYLLGH